MEGEIRDGDKERGRGVKHKKERKVAKRTGDIKSWQRGPMERSMEVWCRLLEQHWVRYRWLLLSFM